jgi:DNA-binding IscR family transcriptional regulator
LEHDPEQITLRDVYCAVEDEELFAMHHQPPSAGCMIGANIQEALEGFFREAEVAMLEKLGRRSVADVMAAVQLCAERRAG